MKCVQDESSETWLLSTQEHLSDLLSFKFIALRYAGYVSETIMIHSTLPQCSIVFHLNMVTIMALVLYFILIECLNNVFSTLYCGRGPCMFISPCSVWYMVCSCAFIFPLSFVCWLLQSYEAKYSLWNCLSECLMVLARESCHTEAETYDVCMWYIFFILMHFQNISLSGVDGIDFGQNTERPFWCAKTKMCFITSGQLPVGTNGIRDSKTQEKRTFSCTLILKYSKRIWVFDKMIVNIFWSPWAVGTNDIRNSEIHEKDIFAYRDFDIWPQVWSIHKIIFHVF